MRTFLLTCVAVALFSIGTAYAQEGRGGAGRFEIGAFPGGGMFFIESKNATEPNFGSYALGGSFTLNVNRWFGFEGEAGGTLGVRQALSFKNLTMTDQKTPNMWVYSGNVVFSPDGSDHSIVPYTTAGIGGLTMVPRDETATLGVTDYHTYLTGNLGAGVKWFSTRHVGLRGDYRFFIVKNSDTAPLFFGNHDNRYGQRLYGGIVLTY